jgi:hypothetical protein
VYLWENGSATLLPVDSFKRTPLLTYYLQRDYNGGIEPLYHMVDEPFDYSAVDGIADMPRPSKPRVEMIHRSLESGGRSSAIFEYHVPISGFVRLELLDGNGRASAVPVDGYRYAGAHMVTVDTSGMKRGQHGYRLRINEFEDRGTDDV